MLPLLTDADLVELPDEPEPEANWEAAYYSGGRLTGLAPRYRLPDGTEILVQPNCTSCSTRLIAHRDGHGAFMDISQETLSAYHGQDFLYDCMQQLVQELSEGPNLHVMADQYPPRLRNYYLSESPT